ncbi:DNA polymerase IV [Fusobacterium varium]|nr:DNA polymerase IV [Fusobacterium varium]
MKKDRTILHYDMDAYYASIEIRDNPKLLNKPLVVGGSIVTTASYEARKFGIHSAMKVSDAKKLCPSLLVIPVNKEKYSEISKKYKDLSFV